jgi:hypothetical protein
VAQDGRWVENGSTSSMTQLPIKPNFGFGLARQITAPDPTNPMGRPNTPALGSLCGRALPLWMPAATVLHGLIAEAGYQYQVTDFSNCSQLHSSPCNFKTQRFILTTNIAKQIQHSKLIVSLNLKSQLNRQAN